MERAIKLTCKDGATRYLQYDSKVWNVVMNEDDATWFSSDHNLLCIVNDIAFDSNIFMEEQEPTVSIVTRENVEIHKSQELFYIIVKKFSYGDAYGYGYSCNNCTMNFAKSVDDATEFLTREQAEQALDNLTDRIGCKVAKVTKKYDFSMIVESD